MSFLLLIWFQIVNTGVLSNLRWASADKSSSSVPPPSAAWLSALPLHGRMEGLRAEELARVRRAWLLSVAPASAGKSSSSVAPQPSAAWLSRTEGLRAPEELPPPVSPVVGADPDPDPAASAAAASAPKDRGRVGCNKDSDGSDDGRRAEAADAAKAICVRLECDVRSDLARTRREIQRLKMTKSSSFAGSCPGLFWWDDDRVDGGTAAAEGDDEVVTAALRADDVRRSRRGSGAEAELARALLAEVGRLRAERGELEECLCRAKMRCGAWVQDEGKKDPSEEGKDEKTGDRSVDAKARGDNIDGEEEILQVRARAKEEEISLLRSGLKMAGVNLRRVLLRCEALEDENVGLAAALRSAQEETEVSKEEEKEDEERAKSQSDDSESGDDNVGEDVVASPQAEEEGEREISRLRAGLELARNDLRQVLLHCRGLEDENIRLNGALQLASAMHEAELEVVLERFGESSIYEEAEASDEEEEEDEEKDAVRSGDAERRDEDDGGDAAAARVAAALRAETEKVDAANVERDEEMRAKERENLSLRHFLESTRTNLRQVLLHCRGLEDQNAKLNGALQLASTMHEAELEAILERLEAAAPEGEEAEEMRAQTERAEGELRMAREQISRLEEENWTLRAAADSNANETTQHMSGERTSEGKKGGQAADEVDLDRDDSGRDRDGSPIGTSIVGSDASHSQSDSRVAVAAKQGKSRAKSLWKKIRRRSSVCTAGAVGGGDDDSSLDENEAPPIRERDRRIEDLERVVIEYDRIVDDLRSELSRVRSASHSDEHRRQRTIGELQRKNAEMRRDLDRAEGARRDAIEEASRPLRAKVSALGDERERLEATLCQVQEIMAKKHTTETGDQW